MTKAAIDGSDLMVPYWDFGEVSARLYEKIKKLEAYLRENQASAQKI